jgi:Spy/CpxP family protein refolding chaperone
MSQSCGHGAQVHVSSAHDGLHNTSLGGTAMKMIRTAVMAAAMFVAATAVARAQDAQQQAPRPGGRGPNVMAILKDSLKVSDAVLAKADSIVQATRAETAPLMEAMRGGDADARAKLGAARQKQTEAIKALLTDEQKAQFDKLMPAPGRRGGGAPPTL